MVSPEARIELALVLSRATSTIAENGGELAVAGVRGWALKFFPKLLKQRLTSAMQDPHLETLVAREAVGMANTKWFDDHLLGSANPSFFQQFLSACTLDRIDTDPEDFFEKSRQRLSVFPGTDESLDERVLDVVRMMASWRK